MTDGHVFTREGGKLTVLTRAEPQLVGLLYEYEASGTTHFYPLHPDAAAFLAGLLAAAAGVTFATPAGAAGPDHRGSCEYPDGPCQCGARP